MLVPVVSRFEELLFDWRKMSDKRYKKWGGLGGNDRRGLIGGELGGTGGAEGNIVLLDLFGVAFAERRGGMECTCTRWRRQRRHKDRTGN